MKQILMDAETKAKLKAALEKEKARLEAALQNVGERDLNAKNSVSWTPKFPQMSDPDDRGGSAAEDNAEEVEEFEATFEAEETLESRLRDVARALAKLEDGNYGVCEQCGEEIPLPRLEANPAARHDIDHAE